MKPIRQIAQAGAAIVMLGVLAPNTAAHGQQPAQIDPDALKVPQPAYDASRFDLGKAGEEHPEKDKPALAVPGGIDLGKSTLHFDTKRGPVDTRVGVETKDPAVLNPGLPSQKASPLKPDYFGLKITTPVR